MKRLARGESFAMVAPTGLGKSTFGLFAALIHSDKCLIILPTNLLVSQTFEILQKWNKLLL